MVARLQVKMATSIKITGNNSLETLLYLEKANSIYTTIDPNGTPEANRELKLLLADAYSESQQFDKSNTLLEQLLTLTSLDITRTRVLLHKLAANANEQNLQLFRVMYLLRLIDLMTADQAEQTNNNDELINCYFDISDSYLLLDQPDTALSYLMKGIASTDDKHVQVKFLIKTATLLLSPQKDDLIGALDVLKTAQKQLKLSKKVDRPLLKEVKRYIEDVKRRIR